MKRDTNRTVLPLLLTTLVAVACGGRESPTPPRVASVAEIRTFFEDRGKSVLTFVGYSGAGYEDEYRMLAEARAILEQRDPGDTIVNIGATPDGIGGVYPLAKEMGFETSGIVSTQAKAANVAVASHCDHVFYVEDETWGGVVEGSGRLSPTSEAMVGVSDVLVGIGGGAVGRDELMHARKMGKDVRFIPADMNHQRAIEKAKQKGRPAPTDFRGDAHAALAPPKGP